MQGQTVSAQLTGLDLAQVWRLTRGAGQSVAVIDTGVAPHPRTIAPAPPPYVDSPANTEGGAPTPSTQSQRTGRVRPR